MWRFRICDQVCKTTLSGIDNYNMEILKLFHYLAGMFSVNLFLDISGGNAELSFCLLFMVLVPFQADLPVLPFLIHPHSSFLVSIVVLLSHNVKDILVVTSKVFSTATGIFPSLSWGCNPINGLFQHNGSFFFASRWSREEEISKSLHILLPIQKFQPFL